MMLRRALVNIVNKLEKSFRLGGVMSESAVKRVNEEIDVADHVDKKQKVDEQVSVASCWQINHAPSPTIVHFFALVPLLSHCVAAFFYVLCTKYSNTMKEELKYQQLNRLTAVTPHESAVRSKFLLQM